MLKYLSKIFIFLLVGLGVVYFIIPSGDIIFTFDGQARILPITTIFVIIFIFFVVMEVILAGLKAISNMLKHDVLLSNHTFSGDKESIEVIDAAHNSKIVLSRSQFDEAAILIVKTMSAISSGVMNEARRLLVNLRKIIGNDAIIDILMLKIYKGEKNFDKMEQLSQKLMQNEEIQLVGMKAALEVQLEKKEFSEALKTANQAFEVRQDLYWVISSAFLLRAKNNDWLGALEVLDAAIAKNITPDPKAARLKAVALYELAQQAKAEHNDMQFVKFITQSLNENSKLIPAALDLADYYVQNDNQVRKAEKVLSAIWAENPNYDIAKAYLELFPNETKSEKIQRMEKLALTNTKRPSLNNLILAELYISDKKLAKAHSECRLFLLKNPATQRIASILSQLEHKGKKSTKKEYTLVKTIKSHIGMDKDEFSEYPKDFQWVCANCGHVSDKWEAICPDCGEVGRNYWHLYVDKDAGLTEDM